MTSDAPTPLQTARLDLGWTQARTIHALLQRADADGLHLADRASLKTMLSRWENGRGQPESMYRRLFCRVYGRDEEELGFLPDPGPLLAVPRVPPVISESTVDYFQTVLREHIKADNLMGPHHLVEVVQAQAALLDQVLGAAQGTLRERLLYLACRYSEFTGWLYQDAGEPEHAMRFTDRAMDYALEINDPCESAYVLMRKSNIACDLAKPDRALGLSGAALRDAGKLPPQIRALIHSQRSRAYAALGNREECEREGDQALREVTRPGATSDLSSVYCNESYISMEAATALAPLGKAQRAIAVLEHSLRVWPEHLRRDQGLCLVRLAGAYATTDDLGQAAETGRSALRLIRSATSGRALRELTRLRRQLAPWRRDAEVSDLCEQIQALTGSPA